MSDFLFTAELYARAWVDRAGLWLLAAAAIGALVAVGLAVWGVAAAFRRWRYRRAERAEIEAFAADIDTFDCPAGYDLLREVIKAREERDR